MYASFFYVRNDDILTSNFIPVNNKPNQVCKVQVAQTIADNSVIVSDIITMNHGRGMMGGGGGLLGNAPGVPPVVPGVGGGGGGGLIMGDFPGNIIQTREVLYRLIISQLFYDGYQQVAVTLSNIVHTDPPCPPSDRLMHVVTLGLEKEVEGGHRQQNKTEQMLGPGLDLEYETEMTGVAPEPATYETAYVTSHKGNCRSGAFSWDGQLCATGSVDASIKILDVDR